MRRGRAGVAFASLVADDAYRGCNACRAVSPPLAREAALGAALQASDETKRGRASACSNDALCRLQRSEHSDAYASQLACNNLQSARCKMPLTALYDSTVRLEALQKNNPSL